MFAPMPRPPPVTRATPSIAAPRAQSSTSDLLQRLRVLERRQVAGILPERPRANRAAHDLRRARLRQRGDPEDALGLERLAEHVRDRARDARVVGLLARHRDAEDPGDLALHLVRDADRGRLGDDPAADRRRLELGRPDALAGDVQRVVGAPVQVPVAVLVDRGPVAVRPHAGEAPPVRLEIALVVAPEAARHPRPRPAADELADLAAQRVPLPIDDVHVQAERREAERDRLDRLGDHRRQEARADLGAAGDVHDRRARRRPRGRRASGTDPGSTARPSCRSPAATRGRPPARPSG